MAVDQHAQAAQVKQALAAIELCTSATVTLLTSLLSAKTEQAPADTKPSSRSRQARPPATVAERSKSKRRPLAPEPAARTGRDARDKVLSPQEKTVLATEVVNAALRLLTAAIKSPQKPAADAPPKAPEPAPQPAAAAAPRRGAGARSCSDAKRPLQVRSLNRVSSSPANLPMAAGRSAVAAAPPPPTDALTEGVACVAQCARIGFSYLRSAEGVSKAGVDARSLQLEAGMSALIGKLIALGLGDLAAKEMRILVGRLRDKQLVPAAQPCNPDVAEPAKGKTNGKADTDVFLDIFRFEYTSDDDGDTWLDLVLTTQLQALKLVALSKRSRSIETVAELFSLSSSKSPAYLIIASGSNSERLASKVPQRLQTVSQLIFSLCTSKSASNESKSHAQTSIPPATVFRLQCVGLRTRLLWWKHARHEGSLNKEVLEPFSRCLVILARNCSPSTEDKYNLAVAAYRNIVDDLRDHAVKVAELTGDLGAAALEALKVLSTLAREASVIDEAINWTEQALYLLRRKPDHNACRCALITRLAALALRQASSAPERQNTLRAVQLAVEALEGNLSGSSSELDDLLNEVSHIRREALSYISKHDSHNGVEQEPDSTKDLCPELLQFCKTIIFNSLRVFSRRLALPPRPDQAHDSEAHMRHEARRKTYRNAVLTAVETTLGLLKKDIGASDFLNWHRFDGILQDCLVLAPLLDDACDHEALGATVECKVSNLYWAYYLKQEKSSDAKPRSYVLQCLNRSVHAAREAAAKGVETTMLAVKLERLGAFYLAGGSPHKGRQILTECLRVSADHGVLQKAAALAAKQSVRTMCSQGGDVAVLGRALTALLRSLLKENLDLGLAEIVPQSLSAAERACLLEWILVLMTGFLGLSRHPEIYSAAITAAADELLQLFGPREAPLRRTRVLVVIMACLTDHGPLFSSTFQERVQASAKAALSSAPIRTEDPLIGYQDHLRASLNMCSVLSGKHPNLDDLKHSLVSWANILHSVTSLSQLTERVDDIHFMLLQLSSAADLLVMKGLRDLAVPTLNMITRVRELQGSVESDEFVMALCDLGLQYLSLGYSGKAGFALTKAQGIMERASLSTKTALAWNMVYAEYFLILGNIEKWYVCLEKDEELNKS
jgi:separase